LIQISKEFAHCFQIKNDCTRNTLEGKKFQYNPH
jgi:hypothetical protein